MASKRQKAIEKLQERIIPIEEAEPYVRILVYGRHGTQKTRFASSAPKPLIVDINEKGTKSAREFHGADVLSVSVWEDVVHAYWMLAAGNHEYESVVIDGLTAMQNLCMRSVLDEGEDRDPNRPPSSPRRQDWGQLAERMKEQVLNFRNLPMHVIFTAHERVMTDEEGEVEGYVPDMSPGARGTAMGAVDIIGRLYNKEVRTVKKDKKGKKREMRVWQNRMLVGPHDLYETKDRTGALGHVVIQPNMSKVIEAAFGEEE